jgi:hypothetical protein
MARGSRLKNELSFGECTESRGSEEVEVLQDDHTEADPWERVDARNPGLPNATTRKHYYPPPVFDPDTSLGDISIIDGIEEDVVRAAEYLSDDKPAETKLDVGPEVLAAEGMVGPIGVAADCDESGESIYWTPITVRGIYTAGNSTLEAYPTSLLSTQEPVGIFDPFLLVPLGDVFEAEGIDQTAEPSTALVEVEATNDDTVPSPTDTTIYSDVSVQTETIGETCPL